VSRLQPYKNVDRVAEAFRLMPQKRLLVIGKGPLGEQLRAAAPDNVRYAEGLSDAQMRWAYAHANALIAASHEDFGLTPLEAGSHGIPTLALHAGGYLDTIRESVNGLFFSDSTPELIRGAVEKADVSEWSEEAIRAHVDAFTEDKFIASLREHADRVLNA
ncbi:glycosyltransferase, partial [Dermabacteraceae bacterium P13101]